MSLGGKRKPPAHLVLLDLIEKEAASAHSVIECYSVRVEQQMGSALVGAYLKALTQMHIPLEELFGVSRRLTAIAEKSPAFAEQILTANQKLQEDLKVKGGNHA